MDQYLPVAIVTLLLLIETVVLMGLVGKARMQYGVNAPATTGNEMFERYNRVHQNTIEQLMLVLPAMWIFAIYVHIEAAALLGLGFFIGRILYARGYYQDPKKRSLGMMIGFLSCNVLLLGALIGTVLKYFGY